ncbi:MAG: hypothetical protein K2P57_03310 [Burkholderiales bacterium]|nr:hypothetical protein [Burkholderiales bacterium]
MIRKIPILALILMISGCATPQKNARVLTINDANTSVVTYPTELRGTYILRSSTGMHYCAEPTPDVALDAAQKLGASLGVKPPAGADIQASANAELSTKVVQLAGRSEVVMLAREMLYRACELTFNNPSPENSAQALEMYRIVASLVQNLGMAERTSAEAELRKASSYVSDRQSLCIQSWRKTSAENNNAMKQWLDDDPDKLSIPIFLYGEDYSDKRSAFIKQHNIRCN